MYSQLVFWGENVLYLTLWRNQVAFEQCMYGKIVMRMNNMSFRDNVTDCITLGNATM